MKRKIDSLTAITIRVTAIALAFWLLVMALITLGGVRDINAQLQREAWEYVLFDANSAVNYTEENAALPGYQQFCWAFLLDYVKFGINLQITFPFAAEREAGDPGYETALIYSNKDGEIIRSGPYYYLSYVTEEIWKEGNPDEITTGFTVIDLKSFPEGEALAEEIGTGRLDGFSNFAFALALRLTGYFEGDMFCPVKIESLFDWGLPAVTAGKTLQEMEEQGLLNWTNELTREPEPGRELVTIYATERRYVGAVNFEENPVMVGGVRYDSLTDALDTWRGSYWKLVETGLTDSVVMFSNGFEEITGEYAYACIAVRCNPLLYAVTALWPVYVGTLVILAAMVALLLFKIRRELTEPVRQVNLLARGLPLPEGKPYEPRWQEPYELEWIVQDTRQQLHEAKTENLQLQAALKYAKSAEEYRRRMISGLTHELKTPLAVIHSYAEGLKEGIAKEKEEQYLSVILEESEKMDAMVLQMLDLSRLEAGRVQLSADQFSLAELTRSVFDKMMPLAEEKGLTVNFTMPNACELTADEGRITQVVTNLASNAIKYTDEGGEISVIVYRKSDKNILCVENTCERLSDEALSKVWDSFYRGDTARTTEGTGLGLTIVKTIVELHGGSCQVFNTPTGVQFQVILP